MRPTEKIEKFLQKTSVSSNPNVNKAVLNELNEEMEKSKQAGTDLNMWRIIMKSSVTKIAAVMFIIAAVILTVIFMNKLSTPAYALDDTIKASRNIRSCHFQRCTDVNSVSILQRETWIDYGEDGEVNIMRVNFNDINCVLVWTKNETRYWRKDEKYVEIFQDELYTSKIIYFAKKYDPKNAIENIKQLKSKDKVQILIREPDKKNKRIIIEVEYPENTFLVSGPFPRAREIFSIDQDTKLIKRVDVYVFKDGEFKTSGYYKYIDYDKPFNSEIFDLRKEVPSDAEWVDYNTLDIGIERGELSEEDIAFKVTREFLEALIAKDYTMALKIYPPDPPYTDKEEKARLKEIQDMNITEIVSIDKPVVFNDYGASDVMAVSCMVKRIDKNGNEAIGRCRFGVTRIIRANRRCIYILDFPYYKFTIL